ncbi:MAG: DNA topoisomerase 3 [Crocinitomicaceae bacterium]|nr:DNA topoisomerase 3 [Crocinitomicaceae bacterium]
MKLCIAEKPSVAKDLANILGANTRHDGYFEGNGYLVSWTFGHLCTLKEPQDYKDHWKYWKIEDLPIFPERFGIKIKNNQGIQKQFELITKLVAKATEVINCGDAGQEGELIQRWVLIKAKCTVPVKRLWISSLTEEAIKEGFKKLKDASKYDNLFAAGNSRAIGDWILGINGTRLYTKKFGQNKTTLSVGRVQTPTLAMIVNRQHEINNFKVEHFWELKTIYRDTEFLCQIDRLKSKSRAEEGIAYLQDKEFEIVSYEQKEGKENNPRLYDLTSIQVDANKKFGYTAEETLKTVQSLYEKKLVTYPRVDTTYLSEDLHPKVPKILSNLQQYAQFIEPLMKKPIAKSKTIFNDKKITDHHAIIPTGVNGQGLSGFEEKIYDLICRRFIAVFYPPCKVSNTTVLGKVEKLEFKTSGKQIIAPGWRVLYQGESKKENTDDSKNKAETKDKVLPNFVKGEKGHHAPLIHEGKTSPPKYYTEASLLRSMETAGKFVDNDEMRDLMKENGIGRPSTRANIIETLFRRKYIERKNKNIHATDLGIQLIGMIKNELLKSPELTGQWENKLRQIEKGTYSPLEFRQELFQMIRRLTDEVIFN